MKFYTNDLVKGHSDFKVKCLTFGLYTQVSDSGPLGPLVSFALTMYWNSLSENNLSHGCKCVQLLTSLSTDQSMHMQHCPKMQ